MNESIDFRLQIARTNQRSGALDQAEALVKKVLDSHPEHPGANLALGSIYLTMNNFELAEQYLSRAAELAPENHEPQHLLGWMYRMRLRHPDSVEAFRRAAACQADYLPNWQEVIFSMQYCPGIDPEEEFGFIRSIGNFIEGQTPRLFSAYPKKTGPIRLGYVGSKMRTHSVSYFLLPVIETHSDEYQVFIYNTGQIQDATTERFKESAHLYRHLFGMNSEAAAKKIQTDGIDILIDLDGYTEVETLRIFCHKPAPLQLTWIGYPGTTGLDCIDYRIVDVFTDPVDGIADRIHTEKLIRLPETFSVFLPSPSAPEVRNTPAMEKGYITFGSFNNPYKLNPTVIAVWARILHAVPGSKLLIKYPSLETPLIRDSIELLFSVHDIHTDRLVVVPGMDEPEDHFKRYHETDIALDPFPYSGTTTTCDALWMGVPVITLVGEKHISRVGLSQLTNVGLPELVAVSHDDYVRIAKRLAECPDVLNTMRLQLRNKMARSPLMDAGRFVAALEPTLEGVWRQYQQKAGDSDISQSH